MGPKGSVLSRKRKKRNQSRAPSLRKDRKSVGETSDCPQVDANGRVRQYVSQPFQVREESFLHGLLQRIWGRKYLSLIATHILFIMYHVKCSQKRKAQAEERDILATLCEEEDKGLLCQRLKRKQRYFAF